MKIRNGALELLETSQVLKNLFEAKDIPIEISFRLAEFAYQLKGPIEIYLSEKSKLVERLADKDEKGNLLIQNGKHIVTENKEQFAKEYQKLTNIEITIDKPIVQLGQWAQGQINAAEIRELSGLIEFTFEVNR